MPRRSNFLKNGEKSHSKKNNSFFSTFVLFYIITISWNHLFLHFLLSPLFLHISEISLLLLDTIYSETARVRGKRSNDFSVSILWLAFLKPLQPLQHRNSACKSKSPWLNVRWPTPTSFSGYRDTRKLKFYERLYYLRTYTVYLSTNNTYFYRSNHAFLDFLFSSSFYQRDFRYSTILGWIIYIKYIYDEMTSIYYIFYFVYDNNLIKPACFPRSVIFSEDQRWTKAN